jgi:hypothetical protein
MPRVFTTAIASGGSNAKREAEDGRAALERNSNLFVERSL